MTVFYSVCQFLSYLFCKTIKYIFGRNVHLWPKRPSFLAETFIFPGRNVHLSWPNRPYFWPNRSFFFWPKRILAETSCNLLWCPLVFLPYRPYYDERLDICVEARPEYSITCTLLGVLNAILPDVKLLKNIFVLFKG